MQACTIGLSSNKDLKPKKRKGEDKQRCLKFYTIFVSYDRNLRQFASTVTLPPPPLQKGLFLGFVCLYYTCGVFLFLYFSGSLLFLLCQHFIHLSIYFGGLGLLG